MSSSILDDRPRIGSYAQAERFWEQHRAEAGKRGYVYLRFPGQGGTRTQRMIRTTENPAFLLYLHDTALIEYAENGRLSLRGHRLYLSCAFIRHHTGLGLRCGAGAYFLTLPDDRTVQFLRTITLDGDGNPIYGAIQRQRLALNRAEHKRRLAQLRKFKSWYDLMSLLYPTRHIRGNDRNIPAVLDSEDYTLDLLKMSWHTIKSHYLSVQDPNLYDVVAIPDTEPLNPRLCHSIHGKGVTS